jgi:hypothetical protein
MPLWHWGALFGSSTKETAAIPPIDAAAPVKVETATFALG